MKLRLWNDDEIEFICYNLLDVTLHYYKNGRHLYSCSGTIIDVIVKFIHYY